MKLNFADTAEPVDGFELLPNGKYHCVITAAEMIETKGLMPPEGTAKNPPGTPMIKLEFTVAPDERYEGRKVWTNIILAGESLKILKSVLYALGWSKDEVDSDDFTFDPDGTGMPGEEQPLVEMELVVKVGRKAATGEYEAQNKAAGFAPYIISEADMVP